MKPVRLACLLLSLVSTMVLAQNPVPLINNPLVPDAAAPGGASFTLTVNGTGFVSSSVVNWNGTALATNFVSSSQLTATVPAANIAKSGTASITVTSPGVAASNVEFFDIRQSFPAVSFGQSAFSTGPITNALVSADFNSDGKLDIANVSSESVGGSLFVNLGNGDGTFQPPTQYSVGYNPAALVTADLNGDGHLDLAFVNFLNDQTGTVSVMLGNGNGTFQPSQNTGLGSGLSFLGMATGDFNGDGKLDLAVTYSYPGSQVLILLGNGDGTFQPPVGYGAGTSEPFNIVTGDFNGDSKLDLAVAVEGDSAVAILLGNGDGSFQAYVEYQTPITPSSLVAADLNGDGKLDLAVEIETAFSILLGNGDGSFQAPSTYSVGPNAYQSLGANDLNGDGVIDVIAGGEVLSFVSIFIGNGDGTFESPQMFPSDTSSCCVVAGDFNGDGLIDLVLGSGSGFLLFPQVTSVFSTTQVNFGSVTTGSTATRKVMLRNIGNTSFTISKVRLVGKHPSVWRQRNNCGSSLGPGASCTFTLTFKPQAKFHYKEALTISDSAVNDLQVVTLQGIGD